MSDENENDPGADISHEAPTTVWTSFDSFFANYASQHGVNVKWKKVVKLHIEKLGWLNDQSKWADGCNNFGI